jgi:hypothetical protein
MQSINPNKNRCTSINKIHRRNKRLSGQVRTSKERIELVSEDDSTYENTRTEIENYRNSFEHDCIEL